MRRILFRGLKRFPYGAYWYVGDLWHCQGKPYIRTSNGSSLEVDAETVGQYIGKRIKRIG